MVDEKAPIAQEEYWEHVWESSLENAVPDPDDSADWPNDIDARKMKFIRRYLPASGTAVEVGCGSARLLARVGRAAPHLRLVAIDESPAALRLAAQTARAFGITIEAQKASAYHLPFETGSVTLVLSGGLLEHFRDPRPILAEMLRVLSAGGTLYADVVPRKLSWYRSPEAERMRVSEWMAPGVYESAFGPEEYRHWLTEMGCKDIVIKDCGVYPSSIQAYRPKLRKLAAHMLEVLDGTPVAARWGWYFMLAARK